MSSLSRRASPLSRPPPPPPHIVSMIHGSFATADKLDFESVSFVSPNDDRRQPTPPGRKKDGGGKVHYRVAQRFSSTKFG